MSAPSTIANENGDVVCTLGVGDRLLQRVEKIGKTREELEAMAEDNVVQEGRLLSESAAKTVRMMVWGGLFLSPMMHTWYNLMERVFVGTGKLVVAKKVVADMVFVAPQMPIWFFTTIDVLSANRFDRLLTTQSRSSR
ncbi:hypothetical protein V7S43_006493 [Phytophthora oleae]|uniref:Uncharacterized protein n=1 Tax=Phytophthora oleae TaxID=2107226 RepID=A0ABD3FRN5_9STRA